MLCALGSYVFPTYAAMFKLGCVTAFATKLADTWGSEIGKAFGKTAYLITTLKLVPRGTEGAVSVEGTVAGVVGSIIIAFIGLYTELIDSKGFAIVILSAFIATTVESYIGAKFQEDKNEWLTNELVNLIMTVIGAAVGMALYSLF